MGGPMGSWIDKGVGSAMARNGMTDPEPVDGGADGANDSFSWKRALKWTALAALGLFLVMQLVPYGWRHSNPPVTAEAPWPSAETAKLAGGVLRLSQQRDEVADLLVRRSVVLVGPQSRRRRTRRAQLLGMDRPGARCTRISGDDPRGFDAALLLHDPASVRSPQRCGEAATHPRPREHGSVAHTDVGPSEADARTSSASTSRLCKALSPRSLRPRPRLFTVATALSMDLVSRPAAATGAYAPSLDSWRLRPEQRSSASCRERNSASPQDPPGSTGFAVDVSRGRMAERLTVLPRAPSPTSAAELGGELGSQRVGGQLGGPTPLVRLARGFHAAEEEVQDGEGRLRCPAGST